MRRDTIATVPDYAEDLRLALRLADAADAVTTTRFRAVDLRVDRKPDHTPVTDADLAAEDAVRAALAAERPRDAVLGEERGAVPGEEQGAASGSDQRAWLLDPIDGTKNFSRGLPVWASLVALTVRDTPVVGVVSAPALGRRWWAAAGAGAWVGSAWGGGDGAAPRRLRVSGVTDLGDAFASTTDLDHWRTLGCQQAWLALTRRCWESRAFGDFWQHCLVAEGALDLAVDPQANPWDLAAPRVIVEQAGGRLTDLAGRPTHAGGSGLSSNSALHDRALAVLAGARAQ